MMKNVIALCLTCCLYATSALGADNKANSISTSLDFAQVENVKAIQSKDNSWCFYTTIRHNDEGWEHYADLWLVSDLKGNKLAERVLAHPHVNEQPFTRSQCNINIPKEISEVIVKAKCNKHDFSGQQITVDLNKSKGIGYTVKRNN